MPRRSSEFEIEWPGTENEDVLGTIIGEARERANNAKERNRYFIIIDADVYKDDEGKITTKTDLNKIHFREIAFSTFDKTNPAERQLSYTVWGIERDAEWTRGQEERYHELQQYTHGLPLNPLSRQEYSHAGHEDQFVKCHKLWRVITRIRNDTAHFYRCKPQKIAWMHNGSEVGRIISLSFAREEQETGEQFRPDLINVQLWDIPTMFNAARSGMVLPQTCGNHTGKAQGFLTEEDCASARMQYIRARIVQPLYRDMDEMHDTPPTSPTSPSYSPEAAVPPGTTAGTEPPLLVLPPTIFTTAATATATATTTTPTTTAATATTTTVTTVITEQKRPSSIKECMMRLRVPEAEEREEKSEEEEKKSAEVALIDLTRDDDVKLLWAELTKYKSEARHQRRLELGYFEDDEKTAATTTTTTATTGVTVTPTITTAITTTITTTATTTATTTTATTATTTTATSTTTTTTTTTATAGAGVQIREALMQERPTRKTKWGLEEKFEEIVEIHAENRKWLNYRQHIHKHAKDVLLTVELDVQEVARLHHCSQLRRSFDGLKAIMKQEGEVVRGCEHNEQIYAERCLEYIKTQLTQIHLLRELVKEYRAQAQRKTCKRRLTGNVSSEDDGDDEEDRMSNTKPVPQQSEPRLASKAVSMRLTDVDWATYDDSRGCNSYSSNSSSSSSRSCSSNSNSCSSNSSSSSSGSCSSNGSCDSESEYEFEYDPQVLAWPRRIRPRSTSSYSSSSIGQAKEWMNEDGSRANEWSEPLPPPVSVEVVVVPEGRH